MAKAPQETRRPRIAVASEQSLVAEAVKVALVSRNFETGTVRWPGATRLRHPAPRLRYDAGLLLSDLDRVDRLRAAMTVTERLQTPWVVLTGAPEGPLWGAVLAAGAAVVLPSDTPLEEVVELLSAIVIGRQIRTSEGREDLILAWKQLQARREDLAARMESLTPREREVLTLLHAGDTVAGIAHLLEIAPATVRSQVKAVLRKLDVNSQLAAVAAYGSMLELQENAFSGAPVATGR